MNITETIRSKLDKQSVEKLAEKLIELAVKHGDLRAIQEILTRLEGKAGDNVNIDPPVIVFNKPTEE